MKKLLLTTVFAGLTCSAQATLIVEETFDYTGVPAGTGTSATPGSAANILTTQGSYTTNLGNYSLSDGPGVFAGSIASPIGTEVNTLRVGSGNTAEASIATTKGTLYYFSFLLEYGSTATQTRVQFNGDGIGVNNQNFYVGVTNDFFGVGSNNTSGSVAQIAVVEDTDYFVVGTFEVANDNAWSINASIFTDASLVPGTPGSWDVTYTQNFGDRGIVTDYTFQSQGGNSYYNGLRVGTTFADVVPEPTSAALLVGAASLLAFRRRRQG